MFPVLPATAALPRLSFATDELKQVGCRMRCVASTVPKLFTLVCIVAHAAQEYVSGDVVANPGVRAKLTIPPPGKWVARMSRLLQRWPDLSRPCSHCTAIVMPTYRISHLARIHTFALSDTSCTPRKPRWPRQDDIELQRTCAETTHHPALKPTTAPSSELPKNKCTERHLYPRLACLLNKQPNLLIIDG